MKTINVMPNPMSMSQLGRARRADAIAAAASAPLGAVAYVGNGAVAHLVAKPCGTERLDQTVTFTNFWLRRPPENPM